MKQELWEMKMTKHLQERGDLEIKKQVHDKIKTRAVIAHEKLKKIKEKKSYLIQKEY